MIFRRQILQRDPPYDFVAALQDIGGNTGWGIGDLAFILNVSRGCIRGLYSGQRPLFDLGQAIIKLRASCAVSGLSKATQGERVVA